MTAVLAFDSVVVCETCTSLNEPTAPRGQLLRLTYSLRLNDLRGIALCGGQGSKLPRSFCRRPLR